MKLNRPAVSHTLVKDNFLSFLSQANKCNVIPLKNFFCVKTMNPSFEKGFNNSNHILSPYNDVSLTEKNERMGECDE